MLILQDDIRRLQLTAGLRTLYVRGNPAVETGLLNLSIRNIKNEVTGCKKI